MNNITILTDYRGAFCSNISTAHANISMDVGALVKHLSDIGYEVTVSRISDFILLPDMSGINILYTSSEDSDLIYKSYIEDIILAAEFAGANTLPKYHHLRSHHNKSMMEALRKIIFPEGSDHLQTRIFGTLEELKNQKIDDSWPKVIKSAFGAGSTGVQSVKNGKELIKIAKTISKSRLKFEEIFREYGKRILRKGWHNRSIYRNKFIIQNMVENLTGDFKILCLGKRYYVLHRKNRPGDFRASGSGLFNHEIPSDVDKAALLDYAKINYETLNTPVSSLDVAFDGKNFHLIEFQSIHFGTMAAENSTGYYTKIDNVWTFIPDKCNIERVFCEAINSYITENSAK